MKEYFTTIGEDSHKIIDKCKPLILGGVIFDEDFSISSNSDGDAILHAITNAISGATCYNVLGRVADDMCKKGITDSKEYLKVAMSKMNNIEIVHVSISIEAKRPKFSPKIEEIRDSVANLLNIDRSSVGISATSGEGLTEFGKGNGIFVTALVSFSKEKEL